MIIWPWVGFILFVIAMLALDLGVLNRDPHVIRTREAMMWTGFCALLAVGFSVVVYFLYQHHWFGIGSASGLTGREAAMLFLAGWIVEQSLSLDNIFVIALIFAYFKVPLHYQHRTLFWGILGALLMRGAMIGAGTALIANFSWTIYLFGGLLIVTAIRMLMTREEHVDPERNPLIRLARRIYPVSSEFDGQKFFTRIKDDTAGAGAVSMTAPNAHGTPETTTGSPGARILTAGRRAITPLFLVLLMIESTDVIFAVDSIPAIFALTSDPFIVFTSNIFAILNLRSLYFALASLMDKFRYLKYSLVVVLLFVGVKMLLSHHYHIPVPLSLGVIVGTLTMGVLASLVADWRETRVLSKTHVLLVVIAFASAVYLPFLGSSRTLTPHEVLIAHPALEALHEGHWLVPRYADHPWVAKPPLMSWLTAVSFAVAGGFGEYAARLPAALCAIGLSALVALLANRLCGVATALFAGLVQATCIYMYMQGRLGEIDMLIALLLTAAHAVLLWRWRDGDMDLSLREALLFHAFVGLGVLAKGPVAIALPGATVLCYCWFRRSWRPLRAVVLTPAVLCSLLLALSWHAWCVWELGDYALRQFAYTYLARGAGLHHLGPGKLFLYFYTIPWLVLPWTIPLVIGARRLLTDVRRPDAYGERFLWAWFLGGLAILTLVGHKHQHYAIPILPPLTILCAKLLADHTVARGAFARRFFIGTFAVLLVVFAIVGGVFMPQRDHRRPTAEFVRSIEALVPKDEPLYVVCLAQHSAYAYLRPPWTGVRDEAEGRALAREMAGRSFWVLTQRAYWERGPELGFTLQEVASEPGRDDYEAGELLVLGRAITAVTQPASNPTE